MATKEVELDELLGDAIKGTEKEIFDEALNGEAADADDETEAPDRSLEAMEGDEESSEAETEEEGDEGEAEGESDEAEKPAAQARDEATGKFTAKDDKSGDGEQPQRRGDPAIALRDERSKRQVAEAARDEAIRDRDAAKSEISKLEGRLDEALRQMDARLRAVQPPAPKAETVAKQKPDKFVDPEGYDKWVEDEINERVTRAVEGVNERFLNASLAAAHETYKKDFEDAYGALTSLNPQNPAHRAVVNEIRSAPNPGARLMSWHREQQTLREVGNDAAAYKQRIFDEAKATLTKDPEFRKQLIEELRAEARGGNGNGTRPRTAIRTPPSLNGAAGRGEGNVDPRSYGDTDKDVFDYALE